MNDYNNLSDPEKRFRVFISYAREDEIKAKRFYNDLKNSSLLIEPWIDKEDIYPGQDWNSEIIKSIKKSDFFIPLFSSISVEKRGYIQREFKLAVDTLQDIAPGDIFVIPVRLDNCEIKYDELRKYQRQDLFPDWYQGLIKILKSIEISIEKINRGTKQKNLYTIRRDDEQIHSPRTYDIKGDDPTDLKRRGDVLLQLERYDEAISYYDKAIELSPDEVSYYRDKAKAHELAGQNEDAKKAIDEAIIVKPNDDYSWLLRGTYLHALKRYGQAIKSYDKALEINPEYADAWNNKGLSLHDLGKYEEAIKSYDKALEINPEYADAWYSKGSSLHELGKYEEAIKSYDKALEIDPEDADAWNSKGISLHELGKYEEAIKSYDKALEINPEYADAWNNKGLSLHDLGKYEEAIKSYDKALEINPEDAEAWYSKGISLDELGKHEEAIKFYNKALEIDPEDADAWNSKGISLDELGKYEEAIKSYNKALEMNPEGATAWNNKGVSFENLKRYKDAMQCYDKTLEMDPNHELARDNKANLRKRMNK